MAVTKTIDSWKADHWFGSISMLADAAEVAEVELNQIDGKDDDEEDNALLTSFKRNVRIFVTYEGGTFSGDSIEELRETLGDLEGTEGIDTVNFEVNTPNYAATIRATTYQGLSVEAKGTGATVVHGLVSTLQRKLEPGVERVRGQPLNPMSAGNVWALVIGWSGALVFGFQGIYGLITEGFNALFVGAIAIGLVYLVVGTRVGLRRKRPDPPNLQLVPASEEGVSPPPQDDRGLSTRARDWIRSHPIISLIGALAVAVIGNLITNVIT